MKRRILVATALLVVFTGIVGVVFIYHTIRSSAPARQNEATAQGLRNSIKQFHLQYSTYPVPQGANGEDISADSTKPLMDILLGRNSSANPKRIAFGEWRDAGNNRIGIVRNKPSPHFGSLVDLWENPYRIVMDANNDNRIKNPNPGSNTPQLQQTIIIYSAGPDGDYSTWDDNIKTW